MPRSNLPNDFYERLSPKKEALLQILLDIEGEWIRGVELRQRMRDEYGLSVPEKSGAISAHQGHYTKWYSGEFSRDLINARWIDESKQHAEYRIGEKYEAELREYFAG